MLFLGVRVCVVIVVAFGLVIFLDGFCLSLFGVGERLRAASLEEAVADG